MHVFTTKYTLTQSVCSFLWYIDRHQFLYSTTAKENLNGPKIQNGRQNTHLYKYLSDRYMRLISSFLKHFSATGIFVRDTSLPPSP